jgi:hypothetical protein
MSPNDPPEREPLEARPPGIQRLDYNTAPRTSDEAPASQAEDGGGAPPPPGPKASGSSSKMLVRLLILAVLALGGWYYFGHSGSSGAVTEEQSPMYQKQKMGPSAQPASLSASDIDQVRGTRARDAALHGDPIPVLANPSPEFLQNLKDGKVQFYAVRLYDTCFEDGDVVTLRLSSGVEIGPVPLTNAGTTVSFPVVASEAPQVTVVGIKDGTGGITVGVQTSGGMWYSGVIPEGGTETMPLTVR